MKLLRIIFKKIEQVEYKRRRSRQVICLLLFVLFLPFILSECG